MASTCLACSTRSRVDCPRAGSVQTIFYFALVERVRLLQEELLALVNEQTNRTLFVLTVVTVLALPMTIIPVLLGMNIGGIPLRENDAGFWLVVMLTMLVVALGAWVVFGRRDDS